MVALFIVMAIMLAVVAVSYAVLSWATPWLERVQIDSDDWDDWDDQLYSNGREHG